MKFEGGGNLGLKLVEHKESGKWAMGKDIRLRGEDHEKRTHDSMIIYSELYHSYMRA